MKHRKEWVFVLCSRNSWFPFKWLSMSWSLFFWWVWQARRETIQEELDESSKEMHGASENYAQNAFHCCCCCCCCCCCPMIRCEEIRSPCDMHDFFLASMWHALLYFLAWHLIRMLVADDCWSTPPRIRERCHAAGDQVPWRDSTWHLALEKNAKFATCFLLWFADPLNSFPYCLHIFSAEETAWNCNMDYSKHPKSWTRDSHGRSWVVCLHIFRNMRAKCLHNTMALHRKSRSLVIDRWISIIGTSQIHLIVSDSTRKSVPNPYMKNWGDRVFPSRKGVPTEHRPEDQSHQSQLSKLPALTPRQDGFPMATKITRVWQNIEAEHIQLVQWSHMWQYAKRPFTV